MVRLLYYRLPWQMNKTLIIVIDCSFLPEKAQFCGYFRDIGLTFIYVLIRQIIA